MYLKTALYFFACLFLASILVSAQPKHEFRGVWVATVDNIDWPTKGNYSTESQKAEFIRLLDMHQRNGMNAVVVQVRPSTDAFYPSPYEPWSEWLTGKQGRPPVPFYDPLEFMVTETHKRGMEFHAWCNPYRAEFQIGKSSIAPTHITRIHPDWFLSYGDKRYFDPGNPEGRNFVVNVIRDIVRRYDVDAIHFDDYFYPYRIAGKAFPDDSSFNKYGNGLNREDWRRSNTDSIILALSKAIREEKPYCRFGISPFGVWRNNSKDSVGSATKAGQTNYDDLYADIVLWLKQGWIDYVAPQLYWEFGHSAAPYEVLIDWWSKHSYGKQCYIGLGIYRAGSNAAWRDRNQLPRMIDAIRTTPGIDGAIYFSSKTFDKNPNGWNDSLRNHYYRYPAIIPPMAWIDSVAPAAPQLQWQEGMKNTVSIVNQERQKKVKSFIVYSASGALDLLPANILKIVTAADTVQVVIPSNGNPLKQLAVTSLDFQNNESAPAFLPVR
ncbi:MAG: family 10 glycosylhydrolase [Bacteroidota bacterium]|nr:family 10 glycosylhydrolase [Bacteroidota bacterium]